MAAPSFRLAGFPVTVEPFFFVVIGLLGLSYEDPVLIGSWVGIAFVSILAHELGHAVAFRRFGSEARITLHGFGGLTTGAGDLGPRRDLVVSLAGPVPVLLLVGLPALAIGIVAAPDSETARMVLFQVIWINLGWSVLNLVPILPLDGGAVTASLLEMAFGSGGRRAAHVVSILIAGGLAVLAFNYGLVFAAMMCGFFVVTNVQALRAPQARAAVDDLVGARNALVHGRVDVAEQLARRAQQGRLSATDAVLARELGVWARLWQGDAAPARAWMDESAARPVTASTGAAASPWLPDTGPSASLRAAVALASGDRHGGATQAAWALANDQRRAVRPLLALTVESAGVLGEVVSDLAHLGEQGRPVLATVHDALMAAGRVDAARWVAARLGAAPPP